MAGPFRMAMLVPGLICRKYIRVFRQFYFRESATMLLIVYDLFLIIEPMTDGSPSCFDPITGSKRNFTYGVGHRQGECCRQTGDIVELCQSRAQ